MPPTDQPPTARASAEPGRFDRTRLALLFAAELLALAHGALFVGAGAKVARVVELNRFPGTRGVALGAPLVALFAAALLWIALARRPKIFRPARRALLLSTPLLALWTLPALLAPDAYEKTPLLLLGLTALTAFAFERTLRVVWDNAEHTPRFLMRPRRVWDFATAVAVAAYAAWATHGAVLLHEKGLTSNYDLGLFENLLFNTIHGVHGVALGNPYFGAHIELILYALAPLYALFPRAETLLAAQAIFLSGTAVPLYLLARRWLGASPGAFAVPLAYLLHPAVHGTSFYDFHFLAFSPFFVALAALFFVQRSWWACAGALLGAMLCREDVALGLAAVGFGLVLLRFRVKAAAIVAGVALVWFVAAKLVFMRRYSDDSFVDHYSALISPGVRGFAGVAQTLLTNPLYVLGTLASAEKLVLALELLVPFAFLPVRQLRTLPLLLPGFLIVGLASSASAIVLVHFHYSCHFMPYLCIATAVALAVRRTRARSAAVLALVLGSAVVTSHFGALVRTPFRASFHEVSFEWTAEDAEWQKNWLTVAAKLPAQASVAAGEHEGPHLARRHGLFALKDGIQSAEYVVFSRRSLQWGRGNLVAVLEAKKFGILAIHGEFVLLQRGAPGAADALEKLRQLDYL